MFQPYVKVVRLCILGEKISGFHKSMRNAITEVRAPDFSIETQRYRSIFFLFFFVEQTCLSSTLQQ